MLRYRRLHGSHLTVACYQMLVGGVSLLVLGMVLGEEQELDRQRFTPEGVYAFFHLLVFGSLIGFVAYNWLLGKVPAALVGTYAYVNPLVALVIGRVLNHEPITSWIVAAMAVILAGVALVRDGGVRRGTVTGTVPEEEPVHSQGNGRPSLTLARTGDREVAERPAQAAADRVSHQVP